MPRLAAIAIAIAAMLTTAGCGEPAPGPVESSTPSGPPITCVGVPASTCSEALEGVRTNGSTVPPVAIRVVCATKSCTEAEGAVAVDVLYADGTRSSGSFGWSAANQPVEIPVAPPPLNVVPMCIGIDQKHCGSMAESALGGRRFPPPIRSIVVRCTGVCVPAKGKGTTVVTYNDGSIDNGDWTYEDAGAPPG